ncbi:unnamed protein product [Ilex paraguariensis]|uniref:Uncharacterized protein n=1 Tax=Ilex paraguariensis TaxID=185542 RepID=A0ABC8SJN3_9AQUA
MVIFLPIAVLKDWICSFLGTNSLKNLCDGSPLLSSPIDLNVPLRLNDMYQVPEGEMQSCLIADIDLNKTEEGWPFISENPEDEFHMLAENHKLSSWEVTKCGLYLAPIWFATEPLSTDNTL